MRIAAFVLAGAVMAASAGPLVAEEEFGGMPAAPGVEETFYTCSTCHSIRLVTQQGLSRESWEETLEWMVAEQEMEPLEPADHNSVIGYLSTYYGIDRRAKAIASEKN
ncbi:MAG: aldehyde dehydrogenase [Proteobacteria bacterium]|nr:aldehyde dehydrogenase [Pseudomonadota bacterium]MDA1308207.1 aldehyde dehydrogenase [Pseudomonadota bacterium]